VNPNDADAFNYKGLALHCLGKYQKAIECYDEAIKINLRHASAWYNKSFALCGLGRLEQARKCLDQAIELSPNPQPKSVEHNVKSENLVDADQENSLLVPSENWLEPDEPRMKAERLDWRYDEARLQRAAYFAMFRHMAR